MTRHVGTATAATLVLASAYAADASQPKTPAIPPAAVSSLHGRIAYSTRGGDIWVMNATGSGRRRVTRSGRGTDFDPDSSPGGHASSSAPPAGGTHPTHKESASKASSSPTCAPGASARSNRAPAASSPPGHPTAERSPSAASPRRPPPRHDPPREPDRVSGFTRARVYQTVPCFTS